MCLSENSASGFTLAELLVVVAVVGILGVLAVTTINPVAKLSSTRDSQAYANVRDVGKAMDLCTFQRITANPTGGLSQAVTDCCGNNGTVPGALGCQSGAGVGLSAYGYGYSGGLPAGMVVNRAAASSCSSATCDLCVSQIKGTSANYVRRVLNGGTVTNGAACADGVAL